MSTYVVMDSKVVAKMAEDVLERIRASREDAKRKYVEAAVEEWNRSWLRRFFRLRPTTYEIERRAIESSAGESVLVHSGFFLANVQHHTQERVAAKLLKASQYAPTINVGADDLYVLNGDHQ
jgi:hypothetical protein